MSDSGRYQELSNRIVDMLQQRGADQAEVAISEDRGISIDARGGELDLFSHELDTNADIIVYKDNKKASVSTTDITTDSIDIAVNKVMSLVEFVEPDLHSGLADKSDMAFDYPDLDLYHPSKLSYEEAIDYAIDTDGIMRSYDQCIMSSEGISLTSYDSFTVYANSHNFTADYLSSSHVLSCSAVARKDDLMQTYYDYTVACDVEKLKDGKALALEVACGAKAKLGAKPISTQNCPVLLAPSVAKTLLSSFVCAVSGSVLYKKTSFLYGKLGEKIFPDYVSIVQRPHLLGFRGSRPFDCGGARVGEHCYVKDGVLESYILGAYSSRRLQLPSTGNAGGVYNLQTTVGTKSISEMCELMGRGLLVTELMGQGVNLVTGDFSKGAAGFWVENGKIQYPVAEVTLAARLQDMFKSIVEFGSDIDCRGSIHAPSMLIESMTVAGN